MSTPDLLALPDSFADKSSATPLEKAFRFLNALRTPDAKYFFGDGYPKNDAIKKDANATSAVIAALEAAKAQPVEPQDGSLPAGFHPDLNCSKEWDMPIIMTTPDAIEELIKKTMAAQPVVPQGWKMVPIEPTKAMLKAPPNAWEADAKITYKAMLAASPAPLVVPVEFPIAAWGRSFVSTGEIGDCISPTEHERLEGDYTIALVRLSDAQGVKK